MLRDRIVEKWRVDYNLVCGCMRYIQTVQHTFFIMLNILLLPKQFVLNIMVNSLTPMTFCMYVTPASNLFALLCRCRKQAFHCRRIFRI